MWVARHVERVAHALGASEGGAAQAQVQEVSSLAELRELLARHERVMVDFYATWCGPCKVLAPFYAKLGARHAGVLFVKANVEVARDAVEAYRVQSMPTVVALHGGRELGRCGGQSAAVDRLAAALAAAGGAKL